MTLESTIEAYLVKRVEQDLGGIALKGDVKGRRFLDRICFLPGGFVKVFELKRPKGGRPSAHQIETVNRLRLMGHKVYWCKTKEEVDAALREG